ncbi:MAG: FtsW/RodA/SpoVE family cell cycle protein, partial [Prevotellaceae bacterium]|nr:FtsW/RodA/SpoVE family cell cycle protein [Prevotellaceae bacterium]
MSITIPKRPKRYFVGDFAVWAVFFSLCIISLVEVYSAGTYLAIEAHSYFSPLVRQMSYLALAALAAFVVQFIHFRYVYHLALLGGLASFLLLLATYFIGQNINNGTRWISIFGLSIQPSELNKLCVILYATAFMANAQKPDGTTRKVAFSVLFPTFVSFAM